MGFTPKDGYDPWITVKKFVTGLLMTFIPQALLYTVGFLETETFPIEYASVIAVSVAVIHALLNMSKHWNDI